MELGSARHSAKALTCHWKVNNVKWRVGVGEEALGRRFPAFFADAAVGFVRKIKADHRIATAKIGAKEDICEKMVFAVQTRISESASHRSRELLKD